MLEKNICIYKVPNRITSSLLRDDEYYKGTICIDNIEYNLDMNGMRIYIGIVCQDSAGDIDSIQTIVDINLYNSAILINRESENVLSEIFRYLDNLDTKIDNIQISKYILDLIKTDQYDGLNIYNMSHKIDDSKLVYYKGYFIFNTEHGEFGIEEGEDGRWKCYLRFGKLSARWVDNGEIEHTDFQDTDEICTLMEELSGVFPYRAPVILKGGEYSK